jgi:hypothetical protein
MSGQFSHNLIRNDGQDYYFADEDPDLPPVSLTGTHLGQFQGHAHEPSARLYLLVSGRLNDVSKRPLGPWSQLQLQAIENGITQPDVRHLLEVCRHPDGTSFWDQLHKQLLGVRQQSEDWEAKNKRLASAIHRASVGKTRARDLKVIYELFNVGINRTQKAWLQAGFSSTPNIKIPTSYEFSQAVIKARNVSVIFYLSILEMMNLLMLTNFFIRQWHAFAAISMALSALYLIFAAWKLAQKFVVSDIKNPFSMS